MTSELRRIYEELGQFARFSCPADVKNSVSDALSLVTESKCSLPFRSDTDALIRAFCAVVENNKCVKDAGQLVVSMCDFILVDGVQSEALVAVIHSLHKFSEKAESDMALKNLQFCATILPKHFLDVEILRMLFSIVLSLCIHPTPIVSSTAFATSQQMISLFFNFIGTNEASLSENDAAKIREMVPFRFKSALSEVAYLLLSDIRCMIFGAPMMWLEVPRLPAPTLFKLWEMIILSHKSFLVSEAEFLNVIESSVIMPIVHNDELPFLVTFITKYMAELPSTSMAVFSYFLGGCNVNNSKFAPFLMFFRCACFRNPDFVIEFFDRCNPDGSLIGALLESLDELASEGLTTMVTFDPSPVKEESDFVNVNQSELALTAPVEIVIQIIMALSKKIMVETPQLLHRSVSTDFDQVAETSSRPRSPSMKRETVPNLTMMFEEKTHKKTRQMSEHRCEYDQVRSVGSDVVDISSGRYRQLITLIWEKLASVLIKGIRYSSAKSVELIFGVYGDLVRIVVANELNEARTILLRILCGLVAKQRIARDDLVRLEATSNTLLHKNKNGLYFKIKRAKAYQLALDLLYNTPLIFRKLYLRLFLTLSLFPDAVVDPKFTLLMDTRELCKFCGCLVKGNAFCLNVLSRILVLNSDRCETVFKTIEVPLVKQFDSKDNIRAALSLLIEVSTSALGDSNELLFLPLAASLLERQSLSAEDRITLLNQIRFLLSNRSGGISIGWPAILRAISIDNVEPNGEVIAIAFNILTVICNNHIKKMTTENLRTIVELVFQFSSQKIDINIALSSFDLLWVIVPIIHGDVSFWKEILSQSIVFVSDRRIDVAVCALRTFFSLLSSNSNQLPDQVYPHLVIKCFVPQLMSIEQFPSESWSVHQLTLLEMCHFSISFWRHFKTIPEFESSFWPLLLDTQGRFVRACKDQEILTNAFQFYEVAFGFTEIEMPTRDVMLGSFASVVDYVIKHEPPTSLVLSSFGRIISVIFTSQKPFFTQKSLLVWMGIISQMCKELPSESMINLSALRALTAVMSVLPLPLPLMRIVTKSMIEIIAECDVPCVREAVLKELTTAFTKHLQSNLDFFSDCKKIFNLPEATDFLKLVSNSEYDQADKDALFDCYFGLACARPEMRVNLDSKILRLFAFISDTNRQRFVSAHVSDFKTVSEIWATFCTPTSSQFDADITSSCFKILLSAIRELLVAHHDNEQVLLEILRFLETSRASPKKLFNLKSCDTWFLFDVTPELSHLADDSRVEVRRQVKVLLTAVSRSLAQAVGP